MSKEQFSQLNFSYPGAELLKKHGIYLLSKVYSAPRSIMQIPAKSQNQHQYTWIFTKSGGASIECESGTFEIASKTVCCINNKIAPYRRISNYSGWDRISVEINANIKPSQFLHAENFYSIDFDYTEEVYAHYNDLCNLQHGGYEVEFATMSHTYYLLYLLKLASKKINGNADMSLIQKLSGIWGIVAQNPGKPWTVENLADGLGISISHFHRMCTKALNSSPMKYVTTIRMEHAKTLLSSTHLSIGEISTECGYANISVFSNKFYNFTGQRPSHYRLQHT